MPVYDGEYYMLNWFSNHIEETKWKWSSLQLFFFSFSLMPSGSKTNTVTEQKWHQQAIKKYLLLEKHSWEKAAAKTVTVYNFIHLESFIE